MHPPSCLCHVSMPSKDVIANLLLLPIGLDGGKMDAPSCLCNRHSRRRDAPAILPELLVRPTFTAEARCIRHLACCHACMQRQGGTSTLPLLGIAFYGGKLDAPPCLWHRH